MIDEFSINAKEYRRALSAFFTGVTILATLQPDGRPRGFTANSFTSVSLDPPLVLVCIAKRASSYEVFANALYFAVSILAEEQENIAKLFASKAVDKFAQIKWYTCYGGSPVIQGAAASFNCRMHNFIDAGDHGVLIGRVLDFSYSEVPPLLYCRGAYMRFSLSKNVKGMSKQPSNVSAIPEYPHKSILIDI